MIFLCLFASACLHFCHTPAHKHMHTQTHTSTSKHTHTSTQAHTHIQAHSMYADVCFDDVWLTVQVGLGEKKHGLIGFCWGGKWVVKAAADAAFGAALTAHPAMIDLDMVKQVQCPIVFCPAHGDVDCKPFVDELQSRPFGDQVKEVRFEDEIHGFCAARGDWAKKEAADDVSKVMGMAFDLFDKNLA